MNRINCSEGPVQSKQSILIPCRKFCTCPEQNAGWRSGTYVQDRGQCILIVIGPLSAATPPAVVTAADSMQNTRRSVPWHPHVPLHVRIVSEDLPLGDRKSTRLNSSHVA